MITAARRDTVIKRFQPFTYVVGIKGADMTASAFSLEVRANVSDVAPLLPAAVGVAALEMVEDVPWTMVTFTIAEVDINALGEPVPAGSELPAVYAVKVDGIEWLAGNSPIEGVANHA